MRITKNQLRRIIREALNDDTPIRTVSDEEFAQTAKDAMYKKRSGDRPWGSYSQAADDSFRDTIIMSPNGDSVLVDGMETYIYDVPQQLELVSGFPMSDTDGDNLIFALEDQMSDGYVELSVNYENGKWSW